MTKKKTKKKLKKKLNLKGKEADVIPQVTFWDEENQNADNEIEDDDEDPYADPKPL